MKFHSEKDSFFLSLVWISVIIVIGVILIPLLISLLSDGEPITLFEVMMLLILLVGSVGVILWTVYFIT